MRILVTGAAGTLGKPLCAELKHRGHEVYGCDLAHSPCGLRCDIREIRQLHDVFSAIAPHVVYHLAAEFGRVNGARFYEQMWSTNVLGTQNVIEECIMHRSKLIFASSSEAYGRLADQYEVLSEDILETVAPEFHNIYALSKWTNERQIRLANGLSWVIMRIFNVYGPPEPPHSYRSVVARFLWEKIHGRKVSVTTGAYRQFLFVDDFVATACNIADSSVDRVSVNVAGTGAVPIEELADTIGVSYVKGTDVSNVVVKRADTSLAKKLFKHRPSVILPDGLWRTEEWMRAHAGDWE